MGKCILSNGLPPNSDVCIVITLSQTISFFLSKVNFFPVWLKCALARSSLLCSHALHWVMAVCCMLRRGRFKCGTRGRCDVASLSADDQAVLDAVVMLLVEVDF